MAPARSAWVALLRGINVGGNNKLPMKDLARLCEGLGCQDVRTYIQSGNVAFTAPATLAAKLPQALPAAIQKALGFAPPVIVRSGAQLGAMAKAHPLMKAGVDPKRLHVGFLSAVPSPAQIKTLDPALCAPGEAFVVKSGDVYFYLPEGVAKTKLTNQYFDRRLGSVMTVRNWNTVLELATLTQPR